jgi:hypothetical protein
MTFIVEGLAVSNEADKQVRRLGEYKTLDDAVAAAKRMVDEFLVREFKPGILPSMLFASYQNFGEVPFIFSDEEDRTMNVSEFNHFQYALARCAEICVERRNENH